MYCRLTAAIVRAGHHTAYLTEQNSFPLRPARTLPNGQAEPSVDELRRQMRRVFRDRSEAQRRGARARNDLAACCTAERAGDLIEGHLRRIEGALLA